MLSVIDATKEECEELSSLIRPTIKDLDYNLIVTPKRVEFFTDVEMLWVLSMAITLLEKDKLIRLRDRLKDKEE